MLQTCKQCQPGFEIKTSLYARAQHILVNDSPTHPRKGQPCGRSKEMPLEVEISHQTTARYILVNKSSNVAQTRQRLAGRKVSKVASKLIVIVISRVQALCSLNTAE